MTTKTYEPSLIPAVYVIIYHTNEDYTHYQIPCTAVPAEIRGKLFCCNGTIVECGDYSTKSNAAFEVIRFLELPVIKQYEVPKEKVLGTDCEIVAVFNIGNWLI